jgi:hypothetical protein
MLQRVLAVSTALGLAGFCCAWNKPAHMLSGTIAYDELAEKHPEGGDAGRRADGKPSASRAARNRAGWIGVRCGARMEIGWFILAQRQVSAARGRSGCFARWHDSPAHQDALKTFSRDLRPALEHCERRNVPTTLHGSGFARSHRDRAGFGGCHAAGTSRPARVP